VDAAGDVACMVDIGDAQSLAFLPAGQTPRSLPSEGRDVTNLALSPDGAWIAYSGSANPGVWVIATSGASPPQSLMPTTKKEVEDSDQVTGWLNDDQIIFWHTGVNQATGSPVGGLFLVSRRDRTVTGLGPVTGDPAGPGGDGSLIMSLTAPTLTLWRRSSDGDIHPISIPPAALEVPCFGPAITSPGGRYILAQTVDGNLTRIDLSTSVALAIPLQHGDVDHIYTYAVDDQGAITYARPILRGELYELTGTFP
jgi:hypothetical protein